MDGFICHKMYTNFIRKIRGSCTHRAYCLTIDRDKECCCVSAKVLIESIDTAKRTIYACVYKLNNKFVVEALKKAIFRGVVVCLIVDYKNNHGTKFIESLVEAGAQILFWNKDEKLHAKFTILDNTHVLTGSFNWTTSERHKVDLIISLYDETSINDFHNLFNQLKSHI